MAIRPFEFAKYKAPQLDEGNIQKLTRTGPVLAKSDDGQVSGENLSDLLGRVSKTSSVEIDNLIGEFEGLRRRLQTDAFNAKLRNIQH